MSMSSTTDMIHIYSQNIRKNYVLVNSLLESQKDLYNILFIQSLPGTSFTLHLLPLPLEVMKSLVLLFTQIGHRWSDFPRALNRHLELCVLFILDCLGFNLVSGEI